MNSEERLASVGRNIQEKAAVIWNVANSLYGAYKPHEYGLVILPMTLIKRFHDCLLEKHDDVLATYEKVKELAVKDGFLKAAYGYNFFNTSKFTFETLRADAENIEDNFRAYINGRVMEEVELGYNKITVESPTVDENGKKILSGRREQTRHGERPVGSGHRRLSGPRSPAV